MDCHHRTNSTSMRSCEKAARCDPTLAHSDEPDGRILATLLFTLGIASSKLHDPDHGRFTAMWKVVEKISLASFLYGGGESATAF